MYGRFCIKFPQSRMKGERHRFSPLSLYLYNLNKKVLEGVAIIITSRWVP
jgi:hypothetical protein